MIAREGLRPRSCKPRSSKRRRHIVMLALALIVSFALAPLPILALPWVPREPEVVAAMYEFAACVILPLIPFSFVILRTAEEVYEARGFIRFSSRVLHLAGLSGFPLCAVSLGLAFIWGSISRPSLDGAAMGLIMVGGGALVMRRLLRKLCEEMRRPMSGDGRPPHSRGARPEGE